MTKEMAAAITKEMATVPITTPATPSSSTTTTKKKDYRWLWWVGAGLAAVYVLSGSTEEKNEGKKEDAATLEGVKNKTTPKRRKLVVRV
jgi:hypothetical protein